MASVNQGGGGLSLKDLAAPLIARGIRVVPARPGMRHSTLTGWTTLATTDPNQIAEWDKNYPNWNLVCVADENVCIVDIDDLQTAKVLGMPAVPPTFTVKSPRPGYHLYFKHTERSRAMGDRAVQGIAEFKAKNLPCCAPGCTRDDGGVYSIRRDLPLIEVPDALLDWFEARCPKAVSSGGVPVDEDFDFEEWCEFYDIEVMGSGPRYFPTVCMVKNDIHHTKDGKPDLRACMIWYDGETLGWKDLATTCEGSNMTIGQLITHMNAEKGENYEGVIWPESEARAAAQAEFDALTNGLAEETPVVPPPATLTSVFLNAVEVQAEQPKPAADAPHPDSFLKYPELRFPYEALPEGRLKDLVDNASEGGLDPGLTCPAILALASALPHTTEMDGDRIGTFVCLLALVGAGKDLAMKRATAVLGLEQEEGGCIMHYTPNGERAVALRMGDKPGTKSDPGRKAGPPRLCMVTPEMEETLKKSKAETSGVLQAMQYFYDYSTKTIADDRHAGDNVTINCRLSWLTALPVGKLEIDRQSFRQAFGENTSHGIASRMLFGFAERRVDPRYHRKWAARSASSRHSVITEVEGIGPVTREDVWSIKSELFKAKVEGFATPELEKAFENWSSPDLSGRDYQHVHKVCILTALLQGHTRMEQSDWNFAVAFIDWQTQIRMTFSTARARRVSQAEFNEMVFEETLRRVKKRLKPEGKDGVNVRVYQPPAPAPLIVYIRWKGMANEGDWHLYGMDTEKTIDALVRGGTFAYGIKTTAEGKDPAPDKPWVRIVGVGRLL